MKLDILNRVHPLIEEAWTKGFRLSFNGENISITDLVGPGGEGVPAREKEKKELTEKIEQKKDDVRIYLESLEMLQVKIQSKILGEAVWIIGCESLVKGLPKNEVAYLPEEVYKIKQGKLSPEVIQKLHTVKKFFGGTIVK